MRKAAPAIRQMTRVAVFGVSLIVLLGWLTAPEAMRTGRSVVAGYLPLPAEAVASPDTEAVGSQPTPQGQAVAMALAALLVLVFGFGIPAPRGGATGLGKRMFENLAGRMTFGAPALARVPWKRVRRYPASAVSILALGLFLGWMSAPDFVREREVSMAALGGAGDGSGPSSHLMDGFSSWLGPVERMPSRFVDVPEMLLEPASMETVELLDLEILDDAEMILAELNADEVAAVEAVEDRGTRSADRRSPAKRLASEEDSFSGAIPKGREYAGRPQGPMLLAIASSGSPFAGGDAPGPGSPAESSAPEPSPAEPPPGEQASPNPGGGGGGPGDPGNEGPGPGDDSEGTNRGAVGLVDSLIGPELIDTLPILGEILILFDDAIEDTVIADLIDEIDGEIIQSQHVNEVLVRIPEHVNPIELAEELRRHPAVADAYPNWVRVAAYSPQDPLFPLQWSLDDPLLGMDIRALGGWLTSVPRTVDVAIIDTAIDTGHPDLRDVVVSNVVVATGSGVGSTPEHGTNVAGILAAKGNNGSGIAGVNPHKARVHAYDVFRTVKLGSISDLTAIRAAADPDIEKAIQQLPSSVRIANLSLAGGAPPTIICRAIGDRPDILFVAAAGNYLTPRDEVYPANCPHANVIAVASLDRTGRVAVGSNSAGWIHIAAPGELILTTAPFSSYAVASGTSMAAPHVAGVASLLASRYSQWDAAAVADVKSTLIDSRGANKRLNACKALGGTGC